MKDDSVIIIVSLLSACGYGERSCDGARFSDNVNLNLNLIKRAADGQLPFVDNSRCSDDQARVRMGLNMRINAMV